MSSVCIILQNAHGKYLMQFRDSNTNLNPLRWDFFGGECEGTESPEESAARELAEELNLKSDPRDFEIIAREIIENEEQILLTYSQTIEWKDFEVNEGAGCAFFTKAELISLSPELPLYVAHFVKKYS